MLPVAGNKLRPFLGVSRKEIRAAGQVWGVEWREDSSNRKTHYERNWIRHEIFPLLEARRPGLASRLAALAEEASLLNLPAREPEAFPLSNDWRFFRASELSGLSSAELSSALALSRLHTAGLRALLQKGSGRYEAKGQAFRLSAGVVVLERRPLNLGVSCKNGGSAFTASSPLGRWEIELGRHERAGFPSSFSLGEKLKKEFQRQKVPLFFRPWVPLVVKEGKAEILLPNLRRSNARIELEPLGAWWLHSIVSER